MKNSIFLINTNFSQFVSGLLNSLRWPYLNSVNLTLFIFSYSPTFSTASIKFFMVYSDALLFSLCVHCFLLPAIFVPNVILFMVIGRSNGKDNQYMKKFNSWNLTFICFKNYIKINSLLTMRKRNTCPKFKRISETI